ncbi:MAG: adenosylcobinamide-GDP ribazoletransferase [Coriobacteriales bacterium]|jgi:adenosylcobinamide-GDP ribazoletransferase|nr:adenosylcobinamide-GDP ribazoletransferase [Coriobacteriales bacterium]
MILLRSLAMALTLFSRLPMPTLDWQRGNMRYALAALPLVGVFLALLLRGWLWLCTVADIGPLLLAAGLTLLPVALSGGIHLDGFCDTADALASRAEPERKRAILKDPHVGAFAVIAIAAYLLLYFALATELVSEHASGSASMSRLIWLLGCAAIISRALAALASLTFPSVKGGGLLDTLQGASGKLAVVIGILWLLAALCVAAILSWQAALALAAVAVVVIVYVRVMALRQFGGMSGDLAGFLIQLMEITSLAALLIVGKVV